MKKYIGPILSLASVGMLFYVMFDQKEQIKNLQQENSKVELIKHERDSLQSEMFTKDIQIGRYEHILDLLDAELDADCKAKVDDLKLQTE
jgi:hypothetical protein